MSSPRDGRRRKRDLNAALRRPEKPPDRTMGPYRRERCNEFLAAFWRDVFGPLKPETGEDHGSRESTAGIEHRD